jgi:tRNA(Ile)-lysidine synthase
MACFEDKLLADIDANGLLTDAKRVLLAVSGGADSVVMAHVLHRLRREGRLGCEFVIGHVNHQLRGADSQADAAFVSAFARRLEMDIVDESVPVCDYAAAQKLSIETAGRVLRLQTLAAMAQANGCDAVATAHHADDLAETVIHRLMRGTGYRGLCGILPVSEVYGMRFIRPMLGVKRREILGYTAANDLAWREDASNRDVDFTRNRIRRRLLPRLQSEAGELVERLGKLSRASRRLLERTEGQAGAICAKGQVDQSKRRFSVSQALVQGCPPWVFYEVMRQVLAAMGIGLRDYGERHFNAMWQLVEQPKAKAGFPGGVEIVVDRGTVCVRASAEEGRPLCGSDVLLEIGGTVQFGRWTIASRLLCPGENDFSRFLKTKDGFVEWFDADAISGPLMVRPRRDGDRFWPIGAKAPKKVGRFLMDGGLDADIRQNAFILADTEKILWLAPIRMAEAGKVTTRTRRILEISCCTSSG